MRMDIQMLIAQQITSLLAEYPEIAEDEVLRADMIEAETDALEFLRKIEERRRDASALAGAAALSIAELEIRQARFENREKAMRLLAFKIMQLADLSKLEMPEATYSIRNVPPKVIITNEDSLPDTVCTLVRKPVMAKVKELLQDGPVAGACMSNGSATISIRTR